MTHVCGSASVGHVCSSQGGVQAAVAASWALHGLAMVSGPANAKAISVGQPVIVRYSVLIVSHFVVSIYRSLPHSPDLYGTPCGQPLWSHCKLFKSWAREHVGMFDTALQHLIGNRKLMI